jgi:hypothetical protein
MRQRFNDGQFYERTVSGELVIKLRKSKHRDTPPTGEPVCTHSQILVYYLGDSPVAIVHQYLRPDGSIGASGRPDPKWLALPDRIIAVRSASTAK